MADLTGKTILHYQILQKLGQGGMGIVYLAEDTKLDRKVAIKFLPGHIASNSDERQRFEIEAKAAAALNHPNIATVYAIEEVEDEMFIVMEYIEGMELKEKLEAGKLDIDECITIAQQIARGLEAAHKKNIIHRDIKSANIMITATGQVKIMDFGLAKMQGGIDLTQEHSTLGTAAYMSPEQVRGDEVDQRTDIWSFGVVLYEMLAGEKPFRGHYEQGVIYSILNEDPDFTDVRIPDEIKFILQKALQKNVHNRYRDMDQLIKKLKLDHQVEPVKKSIIAHKPGEQKRFPIKIILPAAGTALVIIVAILWFSLKPDTRAAGRIPIAVADFVNLSGEQDCEE